MAGYDPNLPVADTDAQLLGILIPETYYFGQNTFKPTVKVRNKGNLELNSFRINYRIDQNALQSLNWNGLLASGEIIDIEFPEVSVESGAHQILAYSDLPNGANDQYTKNDSITKSFFVYETIFDDDFENF